MRQLRYHVAASLDGYIAGPDGEYDWIPIDPEIDFAAIHARFSAIVMGRTSYEVYAATGDASDSTLPVYVYSRTLPEGERKGVVVVREAVPHVRRLKKEDGKPLWLWGGGKLFRELARAGLVDGVDLAILPVLLGGGIALFPPPAWRVPLVLRASRVYKTTGTLWLEYDVRA
jgi:dihydrofolate reductase